MEIPQVFRTKKFWTLVAAIVAAFTAFFVASCSAQYVEVRKGLHSDSVYMYRTLKTRNRP